MGELTAGMTAGHFIFIPAVMLLGLVAGWILGSRAAQDAFAAELRRREDRPKRRAASDRVPDDAPTSPAVPPR